MTSMLDGTSTLVRSLKTGEKPWEKYSVCGRISSARASLSFVTNLALGQLRFDRGPRFTLRCIAEQIHDDGTLLYSFVDLEQVGSGDPAILLCLLP